MFFLSSLPQWPSSIIVYNCHAVYVPSCVYIIMLFFSSIPFCGYRLLFTMNTRPNDNIDTLLHWKDGNFIGICCFAINGL